MKKIRLGVIGIGNMGSEHCRNLIDRKCPEIELTAVADIRAERTDWARKTLPDTIKVYDSGSSMIRDHACDAVLIAVPHYSHEPLAVEALKSGLHVLCEKLIAVEAAAAGRMIQAAKESGNTLALMFNQRTNCLYRKIHQAMESGEFGAIKRIR